MGPVSITPTELFRGVAVPRHAVQQRFRPAKKNLPQTTGERNRILQFIRHYVAEYNPVPPLPVEQLKEHADRVIAQLKCEAIYRDYIGVLINNELWRETLASVPYEKRLLLLPKCLRVESKCPAPFDEEKLGYAVLVAEGSAIVMSLIQTGKIEAIVGVSCLSVLERAFPYMEAAAIPGVAVPLLQDDCIDTTVDLDWVWDYIHLTSADRTRRLDLGALREEVDAWFAPASLDSIMGNPALRCRKTFANSPSPSSVFIKPHSSTMISKIMTRPGTARRRSMRNMAFRSL